MTYIPLLRILIILAAAAGVGAIIAKIAKKGKDVPPVILSRAADQNDTPEYSSSSGGTAAIFINGGAPSGNKMGTISVDGRSLDILYTEAPLEITIPTGRHHVVVEGGVQGDARIDRYIDFGVLDVWTVDMPGRNDVDVIRHQMIDYSEYRRALSDSGFHVTKKQL